MTLRVVVPPHPLIGHWLTILRNASTPSPLYSTALEELGRWLTYEALREWLPHRREEVATPSSRTEGIIIEPSVPLIAIPIIPVGIWLWEGGKQVLPNASLCLEGTPKTVEKNAGIIIYLDQIANGNRLKTLLNTLQEKKVAAQRLRVITALASSPGLTEIGKTFPELTIYTSCIDPEVSKEGLILPGIGNPVLRVNTRISSPI